ncbi:MAG: HI0074 family nucleotidyltransferase substrate-binding subunit [Geminicoccaceae bacterium]
MSETRRERAVGNLGRALSALEQALADDDGDRRSRDSVILNFMLTYETAWKALKAALAEQGVEAGYPKEVFRQAFQAGWLPAEAPWLAMIEDRNLIAHTYNERTAEAIRRHVEDAALALRDAYALLTRMVG